MSIDSKIAELLAGVAALTTATQANTAILERVVAGQEAAIAANAAGGATARKPRTPAKGSAATDADGSPAAGSSDNAAAGEPHVMLVAPNAETAKNDKGEDAPTTNYRAADFSRQEVKNEFIGWLGGTTDIDERKARAAFVGVIAEHFGVKQPFHPELGIQDEDQLKQTLFFLRRKREGLKVDFSADYNFEGDPLADQTVEGDAGDDTMDALG